MMTLIKNVRIAICWGMLALWNATGSTSATLSAQPSNVRIQTGIAAYYSDYFQGRPAASGEIFDQNILTAAHNGYAFGTRVRVTNLANGNSVIVKINDRMKSDSKVLIDLSRRAAAELDFIREGITRVEVTVVEE